MASRAWLAWCLAELGEFAQGRALGYEALQIAEAADQPLSRIIAALGIGHLCLNKGDLERTVHFLERGLELCTLFNLAARRRARRKLLPSGPGAGRRTRHAPAHRHSHLGLGTLYRRTGKLEQAQEHLATATTMYREMDMGYWLEKAEAESTQLGG